MTPKFSHSRTFDGKFVDAMDALVREAGQILLSHWPRNSAKDLHVQNKSDGTPVTDADLKSHDVLNAGLERMLPGEVVISEENLPANDEDIPESCWFIDPLDGTKPFIKGEDHFAIFVGHRNQDHCDFGMMYFPARGKMIVGGEGYAAQCNGHPFRPRIDRTFRPASVVRQFTEVPLSKELLSPTLYPTRNLAYVDFCEGLLDGVVSGYRSGFVELWDICSMVAILQAAGIRVVNHDGSSPKMDNRRLLTGGFVVTTPERLETLLRELSRAKGI